MKINFHSDFKNISELVRSPVRNPEGTRDEQTFKRLLSHIAPGQAQLPETKEKTQPPAPPQEKSEVSDRGPMASFQFPSPELKTPELQPLIMDPIPADPVSDTEKSVKTPSILSVRRVEVSSRSIVEMPREERVEKVALLMGEAGAMHGIDPALGLGVIQAESGFNTNAVSTDGFRSKGLFQLLDSTGKELHQVAGLDSAYQPFDPEQNVELGSRYMRRLHDLFSKETELVNNHTTVPAANISSLEKLAVAAFNAGEGRVASAQHRAMASGKDPSDYDQVEGYLPESTQQYVVKVMGYRDQFEADIFGSSAIEL